MGKPVDAFWIDVVIHHPSCEPNEITEGLDLKPYAAMKAGKVVTGTLTQKATMWMSHLREGVGNEEYALTLSSFLELLERCEMFLAGLRMQGGEIRLTVNQAVGWQDGLIFNANFTDEFLGACGVHSVSLRVQAWAADATETP